MRSALLCGRDHHRIGAIELIAQGPAAIALSRGGARKTYSYTDPNEDCVAFAQGAGGEMVLAADGHHGELGSEAAVKTILAEVAPDWTATEAPVREWGDWTQQGLEALMRANRAILEVAGKTHLPPAPTTFVLALVRPQDDLLLHLSVGDSHIFAVEHGDAQELAGRDPAWKFTPFLGYEEASIEMLERYALVGERSLQGLRAVVLATDGLSEPGIGVKDPARCVLGVAAEVEIETPEHRRAVDICRGVTESALHAHRSHKAGDNMGCSVIWLGR